MSSCDVASDVYAPETERRVAQEAEAAVEQASLQWRAEMEETAREHEEEVRRLKAALAASGAPPAASPRSSSPMAPAMGSISEESRAEVAEARAREAEATARELSAELEAAEAANDQLGRRVAAAEEAGLNLCMIHNRLSYRSSARHPPHSCHDGARRVIHHMRQRSFIELNAGPPKRRRRRRWRGRRRRRRRRTRQRRRTWPGCWLPPRRLASTRQEEEQVQGLRPRLLQRLGRA